jgi:predicted Zn-dependent protease with MMP-like domain
MWNRLQSLAREEMERLLKDLPPALRERAAALPVVFEKAPSRAMIEDGLDADLLGVFVGDDYAREGGDPIPPEIILFLGNIWDLAEGDEPVFREEVRTTLLHEFGHYLGLDEDALSERDLE